MADLKTNLAALTVDLPVRSAVLVTVVGVAPDPTQVLVTDGSSQWSVPCLDGYRRRAAGDLVLALRLNGGDWVVLGKISADQTTLSAISSGTGSPPAGAGLRKASDLWVGRAADGTMAVYTDMTSSAPEPVTVNESDSATWAGAAGTRAAVVSSSTQVAAWYYGGAIAAACSGKLVTSMRVAITRTDGSGPDMGAPLRLGLHSQLAYGQPTITNPWDPQVQLWPGETVIVAIPSAQAALLANGTASGTAAIGDSVFCEYASTAPITITFG